MGSNEDSSQLVIHKFGDEDLSDVTFVVGEEEFKCHKMVVASRSSYFKAMFFSDFKEKVQDKVSIEADPIAFKQLMEMLYTEKYNYWDAMVRCSYGNACRYCAGGVAEAEYNYNACKPVSTLWEQCTAVLKLADQFDLLNYAVCTLENCFVRGGYQCGCMGVQCVRSGVKLIIAVIYGMEEFKINSGASRMAVVGGMDVIKPMQDTLPLDIEQIQFLMRRN